jgi:hypothetical protein
MTANETRATQPIDQMVLRGLTDAQKKSLSDARSYEEGLMWFLGILACIAAVTLGTSIGYDSRGGIATAIVLLVLCIWMDARRREYKAEIKYLQEQDL